MPFAVVCREAHPVGDPLLVHPRAVEQRPPVAAGVGGQRGDRPGVVSPRGDVAAEPRQSAVTPVGSGSASSHTDPGHAPAGAE